MLNRFSNLRQLLRSHFKRDVLKANLALRTSAVKCFIATLTLLTKQIALYSFCSLISLAHTCLLLYVKTFEL